MATPEEFGLRMRELGGVEDTKRLRLLRRVKRMLGRNAIDRLDCYDAVEVNDSGRLAQTKLLKRVYVSVDQRAEVDELFSAMGVAESDRYEQECNDDLLYTQVSLDGDKEFRSYASCRRLLDDRPNDFGTKIIEIDQSALDEACGGRQN